MALARGYAMARHRLALVRLFFFFLVFCSPMLHEGAIEMCNTNKP